MPWPRGFKVKGREAFRVAGAWAGAAGTSEASRRVTTRVRMVTHHSASALRSCERNVKPSRERPGQFAGGPAPQEAACIFSAISRSLVTEFQLRAVPGVLRTLSRRDQGSFDLPTPLGK